MQTTPGTPLNDPDAAPVDPHSDPPSDPGGRRRVVLLLFGVAAGVYVLDQITKVLAVAKLSDREPLYLIDGVFDLRLVRNPGAAFGLATGMTIVFTCVAVIVIVVILRTARQLYSVPWAIALGLLLGGAFGNLTDRVFREPAPLRGHVVDFLHVPHWPVFNLADSAVVCGALLMAFLSLRGVALDSRQVGADKAE